MTKKKSKKDKTTKISIDEFEEFKKWKDEQEKQRIANHVPVIYGYARVSTLEQKLDAQIDQLKKAGATQIVSEKYTGTTTKRPAFDRLIHKTLLKGDTLMITKLDRFARNTAEALQTIDYLQKKHVKINVLNMGVFDNTPTGRLTFTIFSAFAQFERDLIVTRTREGKAYARAHDPNFHEGHPLKFSKAQIELAYELWNKGETHKMIYRKTGISPATQKRRFKQLKDEQKEQNEKA